MVCNAHNLLESLHVFSAFNFNYATQPTKFIATTQNLKPATHNLSNSHMIEKLLPSSVNLNALILMYFNSAVNMEKLLGTIESHTELYHSLQKMTFQLELIV